MKNHTTNGLQEDQYGGTPPPPPPGMPGGPRSTGMGIGTSDGCGSRNAGIPTPPLQHILNMTKSQHSIGLSQSLRGVRTVEQAYLGGDGASTACERRVEGMRAAHRLRASGDAPHATPHYATLRHITPRRGLVMLSCCSTSAAYSETALSSASVRTEWMMYPPLAAGGMSSLCPHAQTPPSPP